LLNDVKIRRVFMERIKEIPIVTEMKNSYMDYSMSVIVGRALPDVRDGLKPVHRRIIYAMHELGNYHNKPYKKSARIVGETLGKYHPHGDVAIYDSLVRMAQKFSLRYPLIDGQGNFGSVDGDPPAAMRYTESRLAKITEEMLDDIDKETVDFTLNFDATLKEPLVLPSKIPNLLINGSSGIAVGMATNIPPHNLAEVVDALVLLIDNPNSSISDIIKVLPGPDFPTGGIILGRNGILEAYTTGHGSISVRGKAQISDDKKQIKITELPYQVNKSHLISYIASLVKNKKLDGVSDIHDRSDKEGLMIIIDVKKGYDPEILLNKLYLMTDLEKTFGVINLALVNNVPRILTIKQLLMHFLDFRVEMLVRKSNYELNKAKERLHIVQGLIVALNNIDDVIQIIRNSSNSREAMLHLVKRYDLSDVQTKAILDMKLQRLTSLEREKLDKELKELNANIKDLQETLKNERKQYKIIRDDLLEIRDKYADDRRTSIIDNPEEIVLEHLIPQELTAVVITESGYVKRVNLDEYKVQKRGGKGVLSMSGEAKIKNFIVANTHDYLLCFTDKGKLHWIKVYQIPKGERYSKGRHVSNLLQMDDEKIVDCIPVDKFDDRYVVMVSKKGYIKKTSLKAYSNIRRGGIIALTLAEGDALADVKLVNKYDEVLIATQNGKSIKFKESDVREMGRTARGVICIRLKGNDYVVSVSVLDKEDVLTVTENGYGKRSSKEAYRLQKRGGSGVINIKIGHKTGKVVSSLSVDDHDEVLLVSNQKTIRISMDGIRRIGRSAQGVRIMRLDKGEHIVAASRIDKRSDDEQSNEMERERT